jgi:DNA-binding NarL/FixJ family response regulator
VLLVTKPCDGTSVAQWLMAGADGCLVEPVALADLTHALHAARRGEPVFCPKTERALVTFFHELGASLPTRGVTERQQQIVAWLAKGLQDKEIGPHLGISHHTVHVLLGRLMRKFGVHTRKALVRKLLGSGNVSRTGRIQQRPES